MATALTQPSISAAVQCLLQQGVAPAIVSSKVSQTPPSSVAVGSSAGDVQKCYANTYSVASGTPVPINLYSGDDPLGNVLDMAYLTLLLIENDSSTTADILTVGGGSDPVLGTDQYTVQPGGFVMIFNPNPGYAVVASTSDTLKLTSASGTITGKITALGR